MAHERSRHIEQSLLHQLRASPVVGVFGHRQVGKTTLCAGISDRAYFTLDLEASLRAVENDPLSFVSQAAEKDLTIDESQYSPALFPAIKEWVRTHKRPGAFLLTGSVRFLARKAIRESLTGRILLSELLPMCLTELHSEAPNFSPLDWLATNRWGPKTFHFKPKTGINRRGVAFEKYLRHGGLPGIAFTRSESDRRVAFDSLLDTLLERDLKMILATTLGRTTLFDLLRELAKGQGQPLELSTLSRATRISVITLKRLLSAFEALFVIRVLRTEGGSRAPVVFFEDQGEAHSLMGDREYPKTIDLARGLFANLRPMLQSAIRAQKIKEFDFFQYRTPFGSEVPLVLRASGSEMGFITLPDENITRAATGAAQSFLSFFPNGKILYVARTCSPQVISTNQAIVPVGMMV